MSDPGTVVPSRPALVAVGAGVALLAAAAFVLSYPGIHALALAANSSKPVAWIYPPALDIALACAALSAAALRGARRATRAYAWSALAVILAIAAACDVVAAAHLRPPARATAAAVAVVPWLLLLICLGLLFAVLDARARRPEPAFLPRIHSEPMPPEAAEAEPGIRR